MEDIDNRSIIVTGITQDLPLEFLIDYLKDNIDATRIVNIEVYDDEKIRLTYSKNEEAEKVLQSQRDFIKLENFTISIEKLRKKDKLRSLFMSSNLKSLDYGTGNTDLHGRFIDTSRVLITNIPTDVTYEHLLLYLEFLSDEIEIEHVDDSSKDVENSIMVKFKRSIEFEAMKEKHLYRPSFMKHKTELLQIYEPNKISVSYEVADKLSAEILELYFSNKKRSGGEEIKNLQMNDDHTSAVITFADSSVAQHVVTQNHQIDKKHIRVRLIYELPTDSLHPHNQYAIISENRSEETTSLNTDHQKTIHLSELNEQQAKYLSDLNSINKKLNGTNFNLLKEESISTVSNTHITEDSQIFAYYFTEPARSPEETINNLLSLPNSSYLNSLKNNVINHRITTPISQVFDQKMEFFGTLSHAESDVQFASSIIDNSFKEIIDNVESPLPSLGIEQQLRMSINDNSTLSQSSLEGHKSILSPPIIDDLKKNKAFSKKKPVPLKLVRRYQISKKNKTQTPLVITKDKLKKPPPPKIVKQRHDDLTDEEPLNALKLDQETKFSESIFLNPHYQSSSLSTVSEKSINKETYRSKDFKAKRTEMASLPDLNKLAKQLNKSKFQVDLAKRNIQSLYGKDMLSTSIDKLGQIQIGFFKDSKYLQILRGIYTKVKFNLNENLRNIYLFGSAGQVNEAKEKIQKDMKLLKEIKYPLEKKEMAIFLKKSEIKQKIFMFIQSLLNRHTYQKASGSAKPFKMLQEETLTKYCIYDVASDVIINRINGKQESVVNISNTLIVITNVEYAGEVVKKFIDESIIVARVKQIKSKSIVDCIKNSKNEWTDFYEMFRNNIDFSLKENIVVGKSNSRSVKNLKSNKIWELRLTGFKEEIENFLKKFDDHFLEIKLKKKQ